MPPPYSVSDYLTDLRAIRSTGSATAETSFYPPLDRLLNEVGKQLKPAILFSTQLRNQGAGMPDGGFFPQPTRLRRNAEPPILQNPERGSAPHLLLIPHISHSTRAPSRRGAADNRNAPSPAAQLRSNCPATKVRECE
jgi:hypothetical protein